MAWISDRTFDAVVNTFPKLVARVDRLARVLESLGPVDTEWRERMEEELKALAEAIAQDRSVNNSAYKLIQDLAGKIEKITVTLPPEWRSRLIELTEQLRNNNETLAAGVTANTPAESEPVPDRPAETPAAPAPEPVPEPAPAPAEEPAPAPAEPTPPAEPQP